MCVTPRGLVECVRLSTVPTLTALDTATALMVSALFVGQGHCPDGLFYKLACIPRTHSVLVLKDFHTCHAGMSCQLDTDVCVHIIIYTI